MSEKYQRRRPRGEKNNIGRVSPWFSRNELLSLVEIAQPGDRIEFNRGRYSHFGIYAGIRDYEYETGNVQQLPCVIHASSPEHANSVNVVCFSHCVNKRQHGLGAVTMDPLKDVVVESNVRINNGTDKEWKPFPPNEILARAETEMKENQQTYNATFNNCEHFVNWCRNGHKRSFQVENVFHGITTYLVAASVVILGFILGLQYIRT